MALFEIKRVKVGLENLTARIYVTQDAPLMTSDDLVATTRIYYLMPHIVEHVCMGDRDESFKGVMGDTEIAHLLEHMTVELLSQSSASADISSGKTYPVEGDDRSFDIELSCPDDVLVMGALSSAVWIANWAFGGGAEPAPDVEAIVSGLTSMVQNIGEIHEVTYRQEVEDALRAEVDAEYQRALAQREAEIAQREAEIAEARAEVEAEARARKEADRLEAEEEARRRAQEEAAERKAATPSWAVDLDEYEAQERLRAQEEADAEAARQAEREEAERLEAETRAQEEAERLEAERRSRQGRRDLAEQIAQEQAAAQAAAARVEARGDAARPSDEPDATSSIEDAPSADGPESSDAAQADGSTLSDTARIPAQRPGERVDVDVDADAEDEPYDSEFAELLMHPQPPATAPSPFTQQNLVAGEVAAIRGDEGAAAGDGVAEDDDGTADEASEDATAAADEGESDDESDVAPEEYIPGPHRVR
ncbi:hypothetical protein [Olsenella massiliensis]|uniref:hypothetical protein n=1 Tax=Olsenella massiliensis TaxID=1622075 RepID=UPI00071D2B28|nr:hypothetical protein [Olsenella massiliensis]